MFFTLVVADVVFPSVIIPSAHESSSETPVWALRSAALSLMQLESYPKEFF